MGSPQDVHYMKGRTQGGRSPRSRKRRASSPRPIRQGGHSECLLLPSQRAFGADGREREVESARLRSFTARFDFVWVAPDDVALLPRGPSTFAPFLDTRCLFLAFTRFWFFLLRFGCWCYYFGSSTLAADTVGSSALLPSAAALWHVWYVPSLYSCYLVCCDLQACTSLDATPLMAMQAWSPSILTFMRPRPCGCANLHLLRWPFMSAFYRRHVRRRRPPLWSAPPPPLPLPLRFWASFDGYAILHSTLSASSR